jgi:hypothetical protein
MNRYGPPATQIVDSMNRYGPPAKEEVPGAEQTSTTNTMRCKRMTSESFIQALKLQTSDAAVFGIAAFLRQPPGRKPKDKDVELSIWFNALDEKAQQMVVAALKEAAELAVFSFLCVLDGVSAIEDAKDKGTLHLTYVKESVSALLNDPKQELLHDIYNDMCMSSVPRMPEREGQEYAAGPMKLLKSIQKSNDGLDIQPIPSEGVISMELDDVPSIMLPKEEHRKF